MRILVTESILIQKIIMNVCQVQKFQETGTCLGYIVGRKRNQQRETQLKLRQVLMYSISHMMLKICSFKNIYYDYQNTH